MRWGRRGSGFAGLAAVAVVALATFALWSGPANPALLGPPWFEVQDSSNALGAVFHPGVILGAASNGSATLLGGIGVYVRSPEFSLPVLASLQNGSGGPTVTNLTAGVSSEFFEGGVYGIGWNGTAWLIGGQASWGGGNFGALVSLQGSTVVNLTTELGGAFEGGGVFALGWNGSSWLVGGNSSLGPALVAVRGGVGTNLSAHLVAYDPFGWIQAIAWNGSAWVVGGEGLLGTLTGDRYVDLWPSAPFGGAGVYAAAWNGTSWLVGGGAGHLAVLWRGMILSGPYLPPHFDQAVLVVLPLDGGWLIGGKGSTAHGSVAPALAYWSDRGNGMRDLSSLVLTSPFGGGEIQGGAVAAELGPRSVLLVGEGDYSSTSGYGLGGVATLSWH